MIDIDPLTGAPIVPSSGSSSNITGGPSPSPDLANTNKENLATVGTGVDGTKDGAKVNSDIQKTSTLDFLAGNNAPQDNSARNKDVDPLLGTGTTAPKSDEASTTLSGDSQQNMRATDATSRTVGTAQHSNDLTAGGSISDNRDNGGIDPATLKTDRPEGVTDRVTPMRAGAMSEDGTMLDFKTRDEPIIAGQHVTEKLNVPLDMAKDKAAILSEIQLVLRDGGMDSSSQIKSLERIASILQMNR